ncbi:MAG: response regulator transcription factor [Desulfitobacterium sp.]
MIKILLVEDDLQIQEIIGDYFSEKSAGEIELDCAANGTDGLYSAREKDYDLVLLDVMLPEVDGFTICRELRRHSDVPIIFLTARQAEVDRLHGYGLGGDDYMVKPFSLAELYAKANSLIRRAKGMVRDDQMTVGRISLDPYRHTASVDEREIELAPKEYALLKLLMENAGKIVTRETLLVRIWGYDFDGNDRVVDNHIKKLRQALGEGAVQLKTVVKSGYRLEEKK